MALQSPEPKVGETWRSRDPRDEGLTVTVLAAEGGSVRIQRFRKTTVARDRFLRCYEPVHPAARRARGPHRPARTVAPLQPTLF